MISSKIPREVPGGRSGDNVNHSPKSPGGGTREWRIYTPAPRYLQGAVNSQAISAPCAPGKEGSRRRRLAGTGNLKEACWEPASGRGTQAGPGR